MSKEFFGKIMYLYIWRHHEKKEKKKAFATNNPYSF